LCAFPFVLYILYIHAHRVDLDVGNDVGNDVFNIFIGGV
jgi:hypothetical protein